MVLVQAGTYVRQNGSRKQRPYRLERYPDQMKITTLRAHRKAILDYHRLISCDPHCPRVRELEAAIHHYQTRFLSAKHSPGQPFRDLSSDDDRLRLRDFVQKPPGGKE